MLVACWSAKGGSGTTVVAVALASTLARTSPHGALVADLAGDVPAVLGLSEPSGPGLYQWLSAGQDVRPDALARIEIEAPAHLSLLPRGVVGVALTPGATERAEVLAALLAADARPVVADCGCGPTGPGLAVAASATVSLLVTRPCYLALRRALAAPLRPSGVVLVSEPGRSLQADDVAEIIGAPVRAVVTLDPAVARAVDAGTLSAHLPRSLERAVRRAA